MPGIHFDITGDNSQFIESVTQIQARVRQTSNVLSQVGKNFNVDSVANQVISLTKVVQEQESLIQQSKERIVKWMDESVQLRDSGDMDTFRIIQKDIEAETKSLENLVAETEKYKSALSEILALQNRSQGAKAPMFFGKQEDFEAYEELLRKREEIQSRIANFDGEGLSDRRITERIVEMRSELTVLNSEINKVELSAAKAASELGSNGQKASEAAVRYYELNRAVEEQIAKINDLQLKLHTAKDNYVNAVNANDAESARDAQIEYDNLVASLQSARMELINLQSDQREAEQAFQQFGDTSTTLRMQLRQVTMELQQLVFQYRQMSSEEQKSSEGREMKEKIEELTEKAGELRDTLGDISKAISKSASDTRLFDSMAGGINVVTSSIGAATGVMAMFGVEEKDLLDIQAKLQASLAISNALTVVQNNLQKESALMLGISNIQRFASAKALDLETAAKGRGTIATIALTAAQKAFNVVAAMNPYVLLATAIISVVGGIYLLTKAFKDNSEEEEIAKQKAQELREEQTRLLDDYNKNVGKLKTSYMELQAQWNSLSSDQERSQWVTKNKDKFAELGLKVNNVKDAEAVLVTNTSSVIQAMLLRAKAAYQAAQAQAAYERALSGKIDENTRTVTTEQARWMANKGYSVTQTGDNKWFAEAEGIKAYNNWLESIADMNFTNAQYGIMDLNKEANKLLGTFKKTKDEVTTPKGNNNNQLADQAAKSIQQQLKYEEEMAKLTRDASRAQEEASIASIQNQAERERAEREAQHNRTIADIKAQEDDIYKKIYEERKKQYELLHKNDKDGGHYELSVEGNPEAWKKLISEATAGVKEIQESLDSIDPSKLEEAFEKIDKLDFSGFSDKEADLIKTRLKKQLADAAKLNQEYSRSFEKEIKSEEEANKKAINSYLKQYGDYAEKKQAIYDDANAEICKLEEELSRATTEEAKEVAQARINIVKEETKEQIKELDVQYGKAKKAMIDLFEDASKKSINAIEKTIQKYEQLLKFLKKDKSVSKESLISFGFTESEIEDALKMIDKNGVESIQTFIDRIKALHGELGNRSPWRKFKENVKDALSYLGKKSDENLEGGQFGLGLETLGSSIQELIPQFDELADGIGKAFNINVSGLKDANKMLNAFGGLVNGVGQIMQKNYIGGAISILGSIGSLFSGEEEALREHNYHMNSLRNTMEATQSAINKLTEELSKSFGQTALEAEQKALQQILKSREEARRGLESSYLFDRDQSWLGKGSMNHYLATLVADLYGVDYEDRGINFFMRDITDSMSTEELVEFLYNLRKNQNEVWGQLTAIWDEDSQEWMNKLADSYEEVQNLQDSAMEQFTTTTKTDVFNEFLDSLYNLADGSETVMDDIAENWQKMVNKMVVNNLIGDQFNAQLEDWYESLADLNKKRTEGLLNNKEYQTQLDALKKEYDGYVTAAEDSINQFTELGIIKPIEKAADETRGLFDDTSSSWVSSLMDFNATAEDWAENLGQMMAQRIIEEMVVPTLIQPLLDNLQKAFDAAMEENTFTESGGKKAYYWTKVLDNEGLKAAIEDINNAYPELKETVQGIMSMAGIEAKEEFSNSLDGIGDTLIDNLLSLEDDAEDIGKKVGSALIREMIEQMLASGEYAERMEAIRQMWQDVLTGKDTTHTREDVISDLRQLQEDMANDQNMTSLVSEWKDLNKELEKTKQGFSDLRSTITNSLTSAESTIEDFSKSLGKSMMSQMLDAYIDSNYKEEITALSEEWGEALASGNTKALEEIQQKVISLYQTIGNEDIEVKNLTDAIKEIDRVLDTTFKDMADSWVSALSDMEGTAEQFAENVGKTMAQKIITEMVAPLYIQPLLDSMQEAYNDAMEVQGATVESVIGTMSPYLEQVKIVYNEVQPMVESIFGGFGVYKKAAEEATQEVEYKLGDLKSNFSSALMDMENSAADFSKDISRVLAQNFVENFVLGDRFDAQMKYWQQQYESIIGSGMSEDERKRQLRALRDSIATAKQGYVNSAMAIQELLGITAEDNQEATMNMADKITYDQADQLLGINLAQELTLEQILATLQGNPVLPSSVYSGNTAANDVLSQQVAATLQGMADVTRVGNENILTQMAVANSHLQLIRDYSKKIQDEVLLHLGSIDSKLTNLRNL